jgi:predicted DsbA family dithiol-disulfide isomerase
VRVNYWLDPVCPWCWMTSRWIVDVAPHRDLDIQWRSISLKMKNSDNPDHPYTGIYTRSHRLLRVLEAVRADEGNRVIGDLYTEYGRRIHLGQDLDFEPAEALNFIGLDRRYGQAADDRAWDEVIAAGMSEAFAMTGDDVGTPIIGFDDIDGHPVAIFGPVISRELDIDTALRLWDGVHAAGSTPGFWELKRTRTESAAIGFRPPA